MTPASDPAVISVVAADSHPLYLIGLAHTVQHVPGLRLVGVSQTGPEALALIQEHQPEVAVLDVHLDGLDARDITRTLRITKLPTRVLLLSDQQNGELALQCLTAGAGGLLTKRASPDQLRDAISAISRGETVLPDEIGAAVAGALRQHADTAAQNDLTERELEILALLALGESAAVIAVRLDISVTTVKTHIQHLYIKLGVNDRGAAVATGIRLGLIT